METDIIGSAGWIILSIDPRRLCYATTAAWRAVDANEAKGERCVFWIGRISFDAVVAARHRKPGFSNVSDVSLFCSRWGRKSWGWLFTAGRLFTRSIIAPDATEFNISSEIRSQESKWRRWREEKTQQNSMATWANQFLGSRVFSRNRESSKSKDEQRVFSLVFRSLFHFLPNWADTWSRLLRVIQRNRIKWLGTRFLGTPRIGFKKIEF